MAMIKCEECGKAISTQADACPSCGAKVKRTSMVVKIALGVVVLVVVSMFMGQSEREAAKQAKAEAEAARAATLTPEQKAAEAEATAKAQAEKAEQDKKREAAWRMAQGMAALIRKSANDPGSIEFSEAGYTDEGAVLLEFRGKNRFNATIINYAVATKDGKVATGSMDKIAATWNKHIAGKTLYPLPRP